MLSLQFNGWINLLLFSSWITEYSHNLHPLVDWKVALNVDDSSDDRLFRDMPHEAGLRSICYACNPALVVTLLMT